MGEVMLRRSLVVGLLTTAVVGTQVPAGLADPGGAAPSDDPWLSSILDATSTAMEPREGVMVRSISTVDRSARRSGRKGLLRVKVSGVPVGANARIRIKAKRSTFRQVLQLRGAKATRRLRPGPYAIKWLDVTDGTSTFRPKRRTTRVTVKRSRTTRTAMRFATSTGTDTTTPSSGATGELRWLTKDAHSDVAWSPNGQQIAYSHGNSYDMRLVVVDVNTRKSIRIKDNDGNPVVSDEPLQPVWSPDGEKLAFTDYGVMDDRVLVKNLTTGALDELPVKAALPWPHWGSSAHPTWSPDSASIIYSIETRYGEPDLEPYRGLYRVTYPVSAVKPTPVLIGVDAFNPQWSADGKSLGYQLLNRRIAVRDLASGDARTRTIDCADDLQWAPDVNSVVGICDDSSAHEGQIRVTDVATGRETLVSANAKGVAAEDWCEEPRWSTDGKSVMFSSPSPNLVPGDTNTYEAMYFTRDADDVFIKTLATGAIQRVNTRADGRQIEDSQSWGGAFSQDGSQVAFITSYGADVSRDVPLNHDYNIVFVKTLTR